MPRKLPRTEEAAREGITSTAKSPLAHSAIQRRWTEAELRMPIWLRGNRLPRLVAEKVEIWFLPGGPPRSQAILLALVGLATAAQATMLTVRKEHAASDKELSPEVFAQHVSFMLRSGRDELLLEMEAAHVGVASARLDSLIATTNSVLKAYLSQPLDKILCDNPSCLKRGRHLLPGDWVHATEQSQDAVEDAIRLTTFLAASPKKPAEPTSPDAGVTKGTVTHGEDFLWVIWFGTKYNFSKGNQAESVRQLFDNWTKSGRTDGCGMSEKTIGAKVNASGDNFRIQTTFARHPALGTMIRRTTKGAYGLFRPESQ